MIVKLYFKKLSVLTVVCFSFISSTLKAQNIYVEKNAYFYLGADINLLTLASGTSIKSLIGFKAGYNHTVAKNIYLGPQFRILLIKSPTNKGIKALLFIGPATEIEISKFTSEDYLTKEVSMFSERLTWVFPLNPRASEFIFSDCLTITTSFKSSKFNLYRTSFDLNIDLQGYDTGFYNGFHRMTNLTAGVTNAFK